MRAVCAALLLALLLPLSASCGGREADRDDDAGSWQAAVLKEYGSAVVRDIYVLTDGIAAVYYDMEAEDYAYDLFSGGGGCLSTVRPSDFSGCPKAKKIVPHDGGCFLLDREHGLWRIEGTEKDGCRAVKFFTFEADPSDFLFLGGILYCAEGNAVRALSEDGKTKFEADVGGEAEKLLSAEGRLYVTVRDGAPQSLSVRTVTPDGRQAGVKLPNIRFLDLAAAQGHELYLRDGSGILAADKGRAERLVGFVSAGAAPEFIVGWAVGDENTVWVSESDYYREGDVSRLSVLRRGKAEDAEACPTVRVGCIRVPFDLDIAAASLLREGIARVELTDYSQKGDPQQALLGDVLSGELPDVILLDGIDAREDYIRQGLFADLTPYLEASGDESLIASAEPFMTGSGLYELPSSVSLSLLAVKDGGDIGTMTADGFIDYAESLIDAGLRPLAQTDPQSLLSLLLTASIPDLISSGFDSPSFGRMLRFCLTYPKIGFGDAEPVIRPCRLDGYEGLPRLESRIPGAVFTGYPTLSGSGYMLLAGDSAAIRADSACKDECWELILLFREAVRSRTNEERSLPFAMTEEERTKTRELAEKIVYFFYHSGGEASAFLEADGSCWLDRLTAADGVRAKVTPETIASCDGLIASASRPSADSLVIQDIIGEEASYYFAGAKTLDDTMRIISSRVGIYLAEKGIG